MGIFKIWNQKIFNQIFIAVVKKHKNWNFIARKTLKLLECTANYLDNSEYISWKSKLDQFYEEKANGIRITSTYDWYEYGE